MTTGNTPTRFELGDLATNRILFALALLGVVLPLNSIASHYHEVGFTYQYTHQWIFLKPFHFRLHALNFFYSMEALLAITVYLYGFNLIFRRRFLEYAGTALFTITLLVPFIYLYINVYSVLLNAITRFDTFYSVIALCVGNVLWAVLFIGGSVVVFNRLEGQAAPVAAEAENDQAASLRKLQELLNGTLITEDEYTTKRAEIISSI